MPWEKGWKVNYNYHSIFSTSAKIRILPEYSVKKTIRAGLLPG
jgi:hypothetical protein